MKIFAQISKVDEAQRLIYARAVQEVPDKADEIFDYESSKPYFEAWSQEMFDASGGKSYGNVRAMHGKSVAGIVAKPLDFNDSEKAIDTCIRCVDDNDWEKVLAGAYTGISIGGSYVGKKIAEKVNDREITRYTAKPVEISLVDSPCIPTCRFFDVVKADGAVVKVEFTETAPASPENAGAAVGGAAAPVAVADDATKVAENIELEVTGSDAEVAEFAKALNESKLTMSDAIAAVRAAAVAKATPEPTPAERLAKAVEVLKGMYNVQSFASALSSIASIASDAEYDMQWEGDDSPLPAALREWLAAGVTLFQNMAAEESAELLESLREAAGESVADAIEAAAHVGALRKRLADPELSFPDLYALALQELGEDGVKALKAAQVGELAQAVIAKAASKVDAARVQEIHDHSVGMGADCSTKKGEAEGDLAKAAPELAKLQAENDDLKARVVKLEAQPLPVRTVMLATRSVSKAEDASGEAPVTDEDLVKRYVVRGPNGAIDLAATMIKVTQATGGKPAAYAVQPANS